jgi:lysophospholipase L1-like esterase
MKDNIDVLALPTTAAGPAFEAPWCLAPWQVGPRLRQFPQPTDADRRACVPRWAMKPQTNFSKRRALPRRRLLLVAAGIGAFTLLALSGCAVWNIQESKELARQSVPFQNAPADARRSLLVVGDSTGAGTGASSPQTSVPGLIAADNPGLRIVNHARVGAKFRDLPQQLASAGAFDAVLIMAGGNDVLRLTRADALRSDILAATQKAREHAPTVILLPPGNVGNAPFFFAPWSWLMRSRAQSLHASVREVAHETGAVYVNLYKDRANDPFALEPERFNAADGLHPNDAGYRLWYGALQAQAAMAQRLAAVR